MISYEKFKKLVEEQFLNYMPSEYRNMKIIVTRVKRVNEILDGLSIQRKNEHNGISPVIYINDMYKDYKQIHNYDEVLQKWADYMLKHMDDIIREITQENLVKAKGEQIVFQLVNTELNKELLADVPNRAFLNLSIIYRLILKKDKEGTMSLIVTNELAEYNGWDEEQLFKFATKNTRKLCPTIIENLADVFYSELGVMDTEMFNMIIGDLNMWVLSNDCNLYGAINMLFDEPLHGLSDQLQSDLYILPSSIHGVIVVPADLSELDECIQLIKLVNDGNVSPEEILSNQVYYYDRDKRTISFATDISTRCACLA